MKDKKGVWRRKEREADVGSIKIRNTDKQFILSTSFNSYVNWHLNRAKFINKYYVTYINYIYLYIIIYKIIYIIYINIYIFIGEGNGTPLQYSCLENPMDRGAW